MAVAPGTDLSPFIRSILVDALNGASLGSTFAPVSSYVTKASIYNPPCVIVSLADSDMSIGPGTRFQNVSGRPNTYRVFVLIARYEPDVDVSAAESLHHAASFVARTAFLTVETRTLLGNAPSVTRIHYVTADQGPLIPFRGENYFGWIMDIDVTEQVQRVVG